jgi:hypothetical protein
LDVRYGTYHSVFCKTPRFDPNNEHSSIEYYGSDENFPLLQADISVSPQ